MPTSSYALEYAPAVIDHLRVIDRRWHSSLREAVSERLRFEPDVRSRNREPVEEPSPFAGAWKLRCGLGNRFRVFYEVDKERRVVRVLAIGEKIRERLYIGGEEFDL